MTIQGVTYSKLIDTVLTGREPIRVYKIRIDDIECLSLEQEPANSLIIPIDGLGQTVDKLNALLEYFRPAGGGRPGAGQLQLGEG